MQLPAKTGMPLSLVLLLPVLSALVLSGCSSNSSTTTTTTQQAPKSTVSLSISPSNVMPGQSATLTWTSTDATSCTGNGSWSGTLPTSGSVTVMLQGAAVQTYTLVCSGAGLPGENSATLSVPPGEAGCTTAAAVRSHRVKLTRAVTAARQAVASGSAGKKKSPAAN